MAKSLPKSKFIELSGAVLLMRDGNIKTAYRGQLREGDHAEFTLLERMLGNENLSSCTLITTLEPCVSRNPPKVSCCQRTTNARIKKVFVGMEDRDPTVDGKGIQHLMDHGVEVKMFDRDLQKVIEKENETFLKQAIDRKRKKEKEDNRSPLEHSIPNFDFSKFSDTALQKFIDEAVLPYQINDQAFFEYLCDFGAMEWLGENGKFKPTGFGILLFGKNPRSKFPQAVLKAHVNYDGNKTETRDFDQALVLVPDLVETWLHKVLPLNKDTSNFKRVDRPSFPIEVIREAIINAIVHRDYEIGEAKSAISIDQDKIIVKSPGQPLPALSLDDLNSFNAPSLSRNPIITYAFSLMNYVEERGFGMDVFKSIRSEYGLPSPKYTIQDPFLILSFPRTNQGIRDIENKSELMLLSKEEMMHYQLFRNRKPMSKSDFAEQTELPSRSAERLLRKFVDYKLIERLGAGRSTQYVLRE